MEFVSPRPMLRLPPHSVRSVRTDEIETNRALTPTQCNTVFDLLTNTDAARWNRSARWVKRICRHLAPGSSRS